MTEPDSFTQLRVQMGSIMTLGDLCVPGFQRTWFHTLLAEFLEEIVRFARFKGERGGVARGLVSMPRRHGKSLFCGELMPASILGMSPDLKVMNTAYSRELAAERVAGTRRIMQAPAWPFPVSVGRVVDEKAGTVKQAQNLAYFFKTLHQLDDGSVEEPGGSYQAVSVLGGATGHGYHIGIIDDWVKNEDEAMSPTMQAKRDSFYDTCFESGQEGDGAAIVGVGTMWSKPDFLEKVDGRWRAQGFEPVWLRFPAIKEPGLSYDLSRDPRADGEGLWIGPGAKFSTEFYERARAGLEHSGNLHRWKALWQQDPQGLGGVIFPKDAWRYYTASFDFRQHIEELFISVDPNAKATGRSFGSIGVYGVADPPLQPGIHIFKLDRVRGHWDYNALRDALKQTLDKWVRLLPKQAAHPKSCVYVEDKANGPALLSDPQIRDHRLPFVQVPKMRSKEACYRLAAPVVKAERVWLPHGDFPSDTGVSAHWVQGRGGFVDELHAQQPVREPNDDADQFAQFIICREPELGKELLGVRL